MKAQKVTAVVLFAGAALMACVFQHGSAHAALIYLETTMDSPGIPRAVPTRMPLIDIAEGLIFPEANNCFAEEGCLGLNAQVVSIVNGRPVDVPGGNLPGEIPFFLPITDDQKMMIRNMPGIGRLSVRAARDLGARQTSRPDPLNPNPDVFEKDGLFFLKDEFLKASGNGVVLGNLFETTTGCTPGPGAENMIEGTNRVLDPSCGPNFHTDISALDSILISQDLFRGMIGRLEEPGANQIEIDLALGGGVGRLKIFSVTLTYEAPEPSTLFNLGLGLAALGLVLGRRRTAGPRSPAA